MTEPASHQPSGSRWTSDVLGRDRFADFLTGSLTQWSTALAEQGNSGLTVAIDSGWGTVKSFFIRNWASDLRQNGHPVVLFDAWENDLGDEAAIALMASIQSELKRWMEHLSKSDELGEAIKSKTKLVMKGLRKALIPASKAIGAAVLKKVTGIAASEIFDAVTSTEDDPISEKARDSATSVIDAGLDKVFESALKEHRDRREAIDIFKESLNDLIALLAAKANASLPVFVFVDEVDRCRPSYAIKLLEEIKHIFGVANVCYVISTNLHQLTESVRAVYGSGFDGYGYLRRFYDRIYTLPDPDNRSFGKMLLSDSALLKSRNLEFGLPIKEKDKTAAHSISLISTAFGLDLRSQKQVFELAEASSAALPSDKSVFILWLLFLSALRHQKPQFFTKLLTISLDHGSFATLCRDCFVQTVSIRYSLPGSFETSPEQRDADLIQVLWSYYDWSRMDLRKILEKSFTANVYSYPEANIQALAKEMPNPSMPNEHYYPSISRYADVIRFAGMTVERS
jgi:hypothetical protein